MRLRLEMRLSNGLVRAATDGKRALTASATASGTSIRKNNERAIDWFGGREINDQIMHFVMRMFFRGIYFPQRNARTWLKSIAQNRRPILRLVREGFGKYREARRATSEATAAVR